MTEIYSDGGIPERKVSLQFKTPEGFVKPIQGVDTGANQFTVNEDQTGKLDEGKTLQVQGSTGNDQKYLINSFTFDSANNETDITVDEDVTDSTADGKIFYDLQTPSVAEGTEIKLFAESIKEVFQKESMTQSIQKGPETHFKGDKTLINDTLDTKHTFEISAWVYDDKQGKDSLNDDLTSFINIGTEKNPNPIRVGQPASQLIQAQEFNTFIPLGNSEIVYDTENVETAGGTDLDRGTDYEMNYSRGEIKFFNTSKIDTAEQSTNFGGIEISSRQVINEGFKVSYDFSARANNIARLIRRMSQLGGTLVMRLDETPVTAPTGEKRSRGYAVTANKINITGQSEKPDEFKLEMELQKGTTEQ